MGLSSDGSMNGYWYCGKSKELFDLHGGQEHLEFLLNNPESLRVKKDELEEFLAEYGTDVNGYSAKDRISSQFYEPII